MKALFNGSIRRKWKLSPVSGHRPAGPRWFAALLSSAFLTLISTSWADAQLEARRPQAQKPPPTAEAVATSLPPSTPVLALAGWPPRTLPGQILTIAWMDGGLQVTDGIIQFQIDDEGRLHIEHASISLYGGRLLLEPVTLDLQADRYDIVLRADSLDLQAVLDAANVEAAHASGSVSGRIPVSLSRRGVAVHQATLATDEQGVLRYRPAIPPAALQQEDSSIKLLRGALENFHYDRLTITLDGDSGKEWRSTVHIAGNNPDLLEGQPLALNVNLTVVPGQASVELGARTLDIGDTLPVYNALFGLGFLEWLGNSLRGIGAAHPGPDN